MKNKFVTCISILFIGTSLFSFNAFAIDEPSKCSAINAVYKPQSYSQGKDFKYNLIIRENADKKLGTTDTIFDLNFYNPKTNNLLGTISIPYSCTQGIPVCKLYMQSLKTLSVEFLHKDFSSAPINYAPAPYAIIIPDLGNAYNTVKWDKSLVDQYLATLPKEKLTTTRPDISIPDKWLFKQCRN